MTEKNCDTWGAWEEPNSSAEAALCHGGTYDGKVFEPCPRRRGCEIHTKAKSGPQRVTENGHVTPFSSRVIASTPNIGGTTTTRPAQQLPQMQQAMPRHNPAVPVNRPQHSNQFMSQRSGGAPVFLPEEDEDRWNRGWRNMKQGGLLGMLESGAEYLRHVDIFPYKKG